VRLRGLAGTSSLHQTTGFSGWVRVSSMSHLVKPPIALCFSFDGVDDYVEVPHNASLNVPGTIMCLLKSNEEIAVTHPHHHAFIMKRDVNETYMLFYERTAGLTFRVIIGGAINDAVKNITLEANKWYHIAGTHDGYDVKLYVNGLLAASTPAVGTADTNTKDIAIGLATWVGVYFDGVIGEVRIYNRALTEDEISDLFNIKRNIMNGCVLKLGTFGLVRGGGTQWLDESPYKNHGTVYGAKRVRCCHCNVVRDYGT